MCVYFWATTPVLISVLTFATYVLMGNELTAAKVGGATPDGLGDSVVFVRFSPAWHCSMS